MTQQSSTTKNLAVITGADGGMGREITLAVARAGYRVVMVCFNPEKAEPVRRSIIEQSGNKAIEIIQVDLCSLASVNHLAEELLQRNVAIDLLMNNAGTLDPRHIETTDGLARTTSVNYVAPYLLTRKLLPLMHRGSRIVNMVSCTYAIGRIDLPDFFARGRKGSFWRIPIYSNTKLALTLFTLELADRLKEQGIAVNASDPGIVSTNIIKMHNPVIDTLCDLFFRPFIRTPRQGAATAIDLLLSPEAEGRTGTFNASCRVKPLSSRYTAHPMRRILWDETEKIVKEYLI